VKIIFLDIDGVLNSATDFREAGYYDKSPNKTEVISPGKLYILEEIVRSTDAKIVISSTWRELYSLKELHTLFMDRGWKLPVTTIIGKTEEDGGRRLHHGAISTRSSNISKWLDSKDNVSNYVILDDVEAKDFEDRHQDHLVITDVYNGINFRDMEKAIDILGRNKEAQEKLDKHN
jgi:hypothetical protein